MGAGAVVLELSVDDGNSKNKTAELESSLRRVEQRLAAIREKSQAAYTVPPGAQRQIADLVGGHTKAARSVDQIAVAYQKLQARADPVYAAQVRGQEAMRRATRDANDAVRHGFATQEQAARNLDILRKKQEEVTRAALAAQQAQLRSSLGGAPANDNRAIDSTSTSLGAMTTRAIAAGAAILALGYTVKRFVDEVATAGDQVRTLTARVNVLTGASQQSTVAFDAVFGVAQRTGTALDETGGAFAKLAIAATDFGATTEQISRVTETLIKLGRVGGSSAQEVASGMQQLGQALASGVLAGDELRSIRENMPLVARAIAKEFGVAVGELKRLGEEGLLVAPRVFKAMLNAGADADAQFKKLPQTMEQASTKSSNAWKLFAASLDDTLGISRLLASSMSATADHVETLARRMRHDVVLAIADVRAEAAALQAQADAARAGATKQPTAKGASPTFFGSGRVVPFEEQQAGRNASLAAGMRATADEMERIWRGITDEQKTAEFTEAARKAREKAIADSAALFKKLEEEANPAAKALATFTETEAKLSQQLKLGIIDQTKYSLGIALARQAMTKGASDQLGALGAMARGADAVVAAYAVSDKAGREAELRLKAEEGQYKKNKLALDAHVAALLAQEAAQRHIEGAKQLRNLEDEITDQEKLTAALAQSTTAYDKQRIAIEAAKRVRQGFDTTAQDSAKFMELATRQLNDKLKQEAIQINRQLDPVAQFNETIAKIEQLKKEGTLSARAQREMWETSYLAMAKASDSWIDGARAGLLEWARTARNVGDQVASAMVQALSAGTDALARIMVGLRVDFKSLLLDLRLSLARAFIGANLTGPLAGLLGGGLGALGGIVPGMGGVGGVGGLGASAGGGLFTGGGFGDIIGGLRFAFGPNGMLGRLFGSGVSSPGAMAGGLAGLGGVNWMGGIGGLLGGVMNFASGNPIGGIAGLLGGALSFIPGLGPIGGIIGALGGILGGLTKKKPKTPQAVSNLMFGPDGWTDSLAMSRGKGSLGTGTGKAAGAVGDIIDELTGLYGLGLGPGTPGGFLINSIGKKTGNLWQVGLGTYADPQQLPAGFQNGGSTVTAAYGSAEEAVSALAAMIVKAGAAGGSLTGLTATQQTALRSEKVLDIESIKRALDFSKIYDKLARGRENITAAEDAIESINDEFRSLKVQAQNYGLDVGIINQRMEEARRKVATDFNDAVRRGNLSITDPDALAREDLTKAQEARTKEAQYLETLFPGLINFADLIALNNAELVELEKTLGHANDNIRDALDRIKFGPDISNLTLKQRYSEALGQYQTLEAAALRGDPTLDKDRLTQVGDLFLQLSRQLYSINSQNAGDISRVQRLYEWMLGNGAKPGNEGQLVNDFPGFASGGTAPRGWAVVGERGPEPVYFPSTAHVFSNATMHGVVGASGESVGLLRKLVEQNARLVERVQGLEQQVAALTGVSAEGVREFRAMHATTKDGHRAAASDRGYRRAKGQAAQ